MLTPNQQLMRVDHVMELHKLLSYIHEGVVFKPKAQNLKLYLPKPGAVTFVDGRIVKIMISQSFIKRFLFKGNERSDLCPRREYETSVTGNIHTPPGKAQLNGLYFEAKWIGKSAHNDVMLDLPRKRNGEKTVEHERIDDAVIRAKQVERECGIILGEGNVQRYHMIPWVDPMSPNTFSDIEIYIEGTADIISPFSCVEWGLDYDVACIDAKLTGDRGQCYVNKNAPWQSFTWGCPQEMDHTQGVLYSELFGIPFLNLVFDYRKENPGWKPVPVLTTHSAKSDTEMQEARVRLKELHQSIRWLVAKLQMWNEEGWPCEPGFHCSECPVRSCVEKNKAHLV